MTPLVASAALLGLAWFAAVNAGASLVAWIAALAARHCGQGRPQCDAGRARWAASTFLLVVRLSPAAVSLVFVSVFVPGHWRLEPSEPQESFGLVLYLLAAAGLVLLLRSVGRLAAVARAGWRLRACARLPQVTSKGSDAPIHEVRGLAGVSLVGVLRPRILVGATVVRELTPAELDVALAHEQAHRGACDNLKRCLMFCAPDFFGGSRAARRLESEWRAQAECVADTRAVQGDHSRALDLASALLKVSRLSADDGPCIRSPAWSSLHEPPLLDLRVRRLVNGEALCPPPVLPATLCLGGAALALAVIVATVPTGQMLHDVTEVLVRFVP